MLKSMLIIVHKGERVCIQDLRTKYKAQVLVDALSYIQKFAGDTVVIKYGGSAMTNEVVKQICFKRYCSFKISWNQTSDCSWWGQRY